MIDFIDTSSGSIRSIVNFNTSSTVIRKSLLKMMQLKKDKETMRFQFRLARVDLNFKDVDIKGNDRY